MNERTFENREPFREDGAPQRRERTPFQKRRGSSPIQPGVIIDYKDYHLLRNFITQTGKIVPRRISKLTAAQQRSMALAIKRARHLALIGYCDRHD